jgi:hypothetical protein
MPGEEELEIILRENVFYKNNMTEVSVSSRIKSIPSGAFGNNQMLTVRIPNHIIDIGPFAFIRNEVSQITLDT